MPLKTREREQSEQSMSPSDPAWFRQVMSQFPTGVCVVTATDPQAGPVGMTVGSFVSVSLDPPLVGFLPVRHSSTWQAIERVGSFCVNMLSADQENVCRIFASPGADRFAQVGFFNSGKGNPVLEGAVAWIDCTIESVSDAGDHLMVLGRVESMEIESGESPLLFFQGGYGRFGTHSLVAPDPLGVLSGHLKRIDLARREMESLSADLSARCLAVVRQGEDLVVAAGAGEMRSNSLPGVVGQRLPFVPPIGSIFAAWDGQDVATEWISRGAADRQAHDRRSLESIRERGHSVTIIDRAQRKFGAAMAQVARGRIDNEKANFESLARHLAHEPEQLEAEIERSIGIISAPVFGPDGSVAIQLIVFEFPEFTQAAEARTAIERVKKAAAVITRELAHAEGGCR